MTKSIDGFHSERHIGRRVPQQQPVVAAQPVQRLRRSPTAGADIVTRPPLKPGHGTRPFHRSYSTENIAQRRALAPAPQPVVKTRTSQQSPSVEAVAKRPTESPRALKLGSKSKKLQAPMSKIRQVLFLIQYPLIAVVAIGAAYSTSIGQWFVAAYAVYVLIRKIESRTSFVLALVLLISIPIFQLLKQNGVAENIAVYTFELLVVGTLQAAVELAKNQQKSHTRVNNA